jgi:hypothetical protein
MNEGRSVGYNFERDHPSQIWFSGFKGEDLNVIFDQNMPNFHKRYKSVIFNSHEQRPCEYLPSLGVRRPL